MNGNFKPRWKPQRDPNMRGLARLEGLEEDGNAEENAVKNAFVLHMSSLKSLASPCNVYYHWQCARKLLLMLTTQRQRRSSASAGKQRSSFLFSFLKESAYTFLFSLKSLSFSHTRPHAAKLTPSHLPLAGDRGGTPLKAPRRGTGGRVPSRRRDPRLPHSRRGDHPGGAQLPREADRGRGSFP